MGASPPRRWAEPPSCGLAVVEAEKTTETFPTRDHTTDATFGAVGQDQTVLDALVIALVMVVLYVFADSGYGQGPKTTVAPLAQSVATRSSLPSPSTSATDRLIAVHVIGTGVGWPVRKWPSPVPK